MKYFLFIIGLTVSLMAFSQNENYVEKVKLANEFKANSTAADAQDMNILAKAADDWFYSKNFNNFLRIQSDDVRYEIPISEIKADGFLSTNWAKRFGTKETTVLNHPYVVSVTRRADPNGSVLTQYSDPNSRYRFDMAIYIDKPGGTVLPPRPTRRPVYLRYYRTYPGYSGNMTKFMNLDRINSSGSATDNVGQMLFPLLSTSFNAAENSLNTYFGSGSSTRGTLARTLAQRFPSELSSDEISLIFKETYPTYSCNATPIGTDFQLQSFNNRTDIVGQLDGFYQPGDYAYMCRVNISPYFLIKSRKYYCAAGAKVTDGYDTIFTNIDGYAHSGMGTLGRIKSSEYYGTPQSDWSCTVPNARLVTCDNAAAVDCTAPPPDPCAGANPPASCAGGTGDECEVYMKYPEGGPNWTDLKTKYPTTCDGSINGTPVINLAEDLTVGSCVIYGPDTTKILCNHYLDLFWDEDKNGQPDGASFHRYSLLINATVPAAVDGAQTEYNLNVPPSLKAGSCTTQPIDTTKPHESLCEKVTLNQNPPNNLMVYQNYWSSSVCPQPVLPSCLPEIVDRQCVYEINPWRGDSWPMVDGTEANSVSAGCTFSPDGTIAFCHRSQRVDTLPSCGGLVGASVTIDWIDAPYNTGILISN